MEETRTARELIIETLMEKTAVKAAVIANTKNAFTLFKAAMQKFVESYNTELHGLGSPVVLEYRDRGEFEAEMRVGDDMLVFNMQTNVFEFDENHSVWKTSYVSKDAYAAQCGNINIYNFLADSFKFNSIEDLGYLIARIFVNKDGHYLVEGKRQLGFLYNDFMNAEICPEDVYNILESAVLFTMDFDLIIPEYEQVSVITVGQIQENISSAKSQSQKKLGFSFNADISGF